VYAAALAALDGARPGGAGSEPAGSPGPAAYPTSSSLQGRTIVVSAGGTREPLDPVRFLGNRSSGKQGLALAEVAAAVWDAVQEIL
jgi:phosphopantothenoylcysteine decarboxylase/phosphopantothenate--cysteine ligase